MSSVRSERAARSRVSGLMRMPMNGGSVPATMPAATCCAACDGVAVLFLVGAVAVAVLEVDAEVLDRLARELLAHALV